LSFVEKLKCLKTGVKRVVQDEEQDLRNLLRQLIEVVVHQQVRILIVNFDNDFFRIVDVSEVPQVVENTIQKIFDEIVFSC